eukprot:1878114-Rhodomonas_salina.8
MLVGVARWLPCAESASAAGHWLGNGFSATRPTSNVPVTDTWALTGSWCVFFSSSAACSFGAWSSGWFACCPMTMSPSSDVSANASSTTFTRPWWLPSVAASAGGVAYGQFSGSESPCKPERGHVKACLLAISPQDTNEQ